MEIHRIFEDGILLYVHRVFHKHIWAVFEFAKLVTIYCWQEGNFYVWQSGKQKANSIKTIVIWVLAGVLVENDLVLNLESARNALKNFKNCFCMHMFLIVRHKSVHIVNNLP